MPMEPHFMHGTGALSKRKTSPKNNFLADKFITVVEKVKATLIMTKSSACFKPHFFFASPVVYFFYFAPCH